MVYMAGNPCGAFFGGGGLFIPKSLHKLNMQMLFLFIVKEYDGIGKIPPERKMSVNGIAFPQN